MSPVHPVAFDGRGARPLYPIPGEETITTGAPDRPLTYRDAGVDIDAGARLVEVIEPLARATRRPGGDGALGGFGGIFDLAAAGLRDPLLVAATDGVGTKLRVAIDSGRHDTVGIDLVAMCVNDLAAQGAEPLFFLDYYATGALSVAQARSVVQGIARGCSEAGCALLGGETAEMPGMYAGGDYDLAGFAVGAVERGGLIDGGAARAGDVIFGIASSGMHANGLSLAREVVVRSGLSVDEPCPFAPGRALVDELLEPTRIYVKACRAACRTGGVTGIAHITGGGLVENPPRAFGSALAAHIDCAAWTAPPVFRWLSDAGGIEAAEMARTFNCGIGMVMIARPEEARSVAGALSSAGETVFEIGRLRERGPDGTAVVLGNIGSVAS